MFSTSDEVVTSVSGSAESESPTKGDGTPPSQELEPSPELLTVGHSSHCLCEQRPKEAIGYPMFPHVLEHLEQLALARTTIPEFCGKEADQMAAQEFPRLVLALFEPRAVKPLLLLCLWLED